MLESFVKNVFITIMFTTIALSLYYVFFGQGSWEGALWYLSRQVEIPMAYYYHTYSYAPNTYGMVYLDLELGCTVVGKSTMADITAESLIGVSQTNTAYIGYPSGYYTTGWH